MSSPYRTRSASKFIQANEIEIKNVSSDWHKPPPTKRKVFHNNTTTSSVVVDNIAGNDDAATFSRKIGVQFTVRNINNVDKQRQTFFADFLVHAFETNDRTFYKLDFNKQFVGSFHDKDAEFDTKQNWDRIPVV
jgi:hypothetical protein